MVHSGQAVTPEGILEQYGREVVVRERLARLTQWGEIELRGYRSVCKRGRMSLARRAVHSWANLLGFRWFRDQEL